MHGSDLELLMSALDQKQTFRNGRPMSALPPKADIAEGDRHVRFVPKADILRCGGDWRYSITSVGDRHHARRMVRPSALAVVRLMTSSYLVGACTGRSPSRSSAVRHRPRRTRPARLAQEAQRANGRLKQACLKNASFNDSHLGTGCLPTADTARLRPRPSSADNRCFDARSA